MGEWTWSTVVSPATIVAIVGSIVGFGGWIFSLLTAMGSKQHEFKGVVKDLAELRSTRAIEREADRKEREMAQIAFNAGMEAMRGNLNDFQRQAAERFATKQEMALLEDRTNKGMDRIVDRLEQISGRLESIGDAIIKTLADGRRQ